jgi:hypothetical protein
LAVSVPNSGTESKGIICMRQAVGLVRNERGSGTAI